MARPVGRREEMKKMMRSVFVLLIAVVCCLGMTMPGFAAVWNFYGSARVTTFMTETDNPTGIADTRNYNQSLQGNARIGAKIKVSDELVGRFEYGSGVNIRHLYGEWNFGAGKFLVGQTMSPLNITPSARTYRGDESMYNYGAVYAGRQPMVRLNFGWFQIAAVAPTSHTLGLVSSTTEFNLPKMEARIQWDFNQGYIRLAGGYQNYELTDSASGNAYDVESMIGAIGGEVDFWRMTLGASLWIGQNTGPYNLRCAADDMPVISGSDLIDNDGYGFVLVAGYKHNNMLSFEAGYGYVAAELDSDAFVKDDVMAWYLQSKITLAPGVFIVPELGIIDNKNDNTGAEKSEILYYGMKWQINF